MTTVVAVLALAALAFGNPIVVPALRRWWRARGRDRYDFCEVCGARPRRIRVVSDVAVPDEALEAEPLLGATGMSATFCGRHAPAGARKRTNQRV